MSQKTAPATPAAAPVRAPSPVEVKPAAATKTERFSSIFFSYFTYTYNSRLAYASGFLILFLIFGGTSFAAEGALPGDILYPIKIHVNESVGSLLAFTPKSRAKTAVSHALARLDETEKLMSKNKLSSTTRVEVAQGFTAETNTLSKEVATLKTSGDVQDATETESNFEQVLKTHRTALVAIASPTAQPLGDKVESSAPQATSVATMRAQPSIATSTAPQSSKTGAEQRLNTVTSKITEIESLATSSVAVSASSSLSSEISAARDNITKGVGKMSAHRYTEASKLFDSALKNLQKVSIPRSQSRDTIQALLQKYIQSSEAGTPTTTTATTTIENATTTNQTATSTPEGGGDDTASTTTPVPNDQ